MGVLRIEPFFKTEKSFVKITLLKPSGYERSIEKEFRFQINPQDREGIRWYLEDFLEYPLDPAPKIARRIEVRIKEIGEQLFQALFPDGDDAHGLWAEFASELAASRIEIVAQSTFFAKVPWELLRHPAEDIPIALRTRVFVRMPSRETQHSRCKIREVRNFRILLVICRPDAQYDVPFRSVAKKLIGELTQPAQRLLQIDVLRPPTFEGFCIALREAKENRKPYHLVHFDGHGIYQDLHSSGAKRGYLYFENPKSHENRQLIHGTIIGEVLNENAVPLLTLNACRSAYAEAMAEPKDTVWDEATPERGFGSLAEEVLRTGVHGVVAMSNNVNVATAALFIADLYRALYEGSALGRAVSRGRKKLFEQATRDIGFGPFPMQDWIVPIVYEARAESPFVRSGESERNSPQIDIPRGAANNLVFKGDIPPRSDVDFFGGDDTILAIDRIFDSGSLALIHGCAGSGKTSAALEFARWYQTTGGLVGPVCLTSFERCKKIPEVLNSIAELFPDELAKDGVHWSALNDSRQCERILALLKEKQLLWIWDNVEEVAGFPNPEDSQWKKEEQEELERILCEVRNTRTKIILTSRRKEARWLKETSARVIVSPLPIMERVRFMRALAEQHAEVLPTVENWLPLLRYTGGNPLTQRIVVQQALCKGLNTREQIEEFVNKLSMGEDLFGDEESCVDRTRSLWASMNYGFAKVFKENEKKRFSHLHFFQGVVEIKAFQSMLDALFQGNESKSATLIDLLNRAVNVGLLTHIREGFFTIHPALPYFLKKHHEHYFGVVKASAEKAFVNSMVVRAYHGYCRYHAGYLDIASELKKEERNLLKAWSYAQQKLWFPELLDLMEYGFDLLYGHYAQHEDWKRVVEAAKLHFVDPSNDGPLPGMEGEWSKLTEFRVHLMRKARDYKNAERLNQMRLEYLQH